MAIHSQSVVVLQVFANVSFPYSSLIEHLTLLLLLVFFHLQYFRQLLTKSDQYVVNVLIIVLFKYSLWNGKTRKCYVVTHKVRELKVNMIRQQNKADIWHYKINLKLQRFSCSRRYKSSGSWTQLNCTGEGGHHGLAVVGKMSMQPVVSL